MPGSSEEDRRLPVSYTNRRHLLHVFRQPFDRLRTSLLPKPNASLVVGVALGQVLSVPRTSSRNTTNRTTSLYGMAAPDKAFGR